MRNVLKLIMSSIVGVILFQVGSYFLYAKSDIEVCYYKNFTPLLYDIERLHIYSIVDLNTGEKQEIKQILEPRYQVVDFSKGNISVDENWNDSAITKVQITVNYNFPFRAIVYESLRNVHYIELWRSEFYCFFGKWVLIEKVNVGQS